MIEDYQKELHDEDACEPSECRYCAEEMAETLAEEEGDRADCIYEQEDGSA